MGEPVILNSLLWARPCAKPSFVPVSRSRGSKAAGLRYERAFAKFMAPLGIIHGQWFEYEDRRGVRYCQTDLLFPISLRLLAIIEVKYTLVDRAFDQLLDVYAPVVEAAYNIPVATVVVFKNWGRAEYNAPVYDDMTSAATYSWESGQVALLHWMGQPVVSKSNQHTANVLQHIRDQRAL